MTRCVHRKFQGIYKHFLTNQGYGIQDEHTSSTVFLYTSNNHADPEIENTIEFTISSKIKY